MKKIEAIIKRANFPIISGELERIGITVIDRRNLEDSKISKPRNGSRAGFTSLMAVPLSKIELVVSDKQARKVVEIISKKSGLSSESEGKIFISEMTEVVDMQTMEGKKDLEENAPERKEKSKRSRLIPLQKYTLLKLEKIYEENSDLLKTDYRIRSFSDFVNFCIMGYLPTLEKQLKHPTIIYNDKFGQI
ncbi:transcriptional regulator [Nitrosopumilus sp. b1]|uniref:P-II family nitrogen regulator n=1 Tax=Nitrosopumilus sp. b1 TaxID=2109907 RepID=UPI0015F6B27C|nr:P-II family nitrogen regulator [Nitrosopumilus sp. b1]KAF6243138.1 transcriptional regulator [Nitrosopumilus sp. b1]